MAKVHPNVAVPESPAGAVVEEERQQPTVLTVWRKSLLFNCDGFTVFDATGGLAFRVDRYGSSPYGRRRRRAAEDVVLMDAAGKPLLTVRRKIKLSLRLGEHWVLYEGDAGAAGAKPLLSVRRHHVGLHRRASDKTLAHITPLGCSPSGADAAAYVVEGSYGRRSCAVRDARGGRRRGGGGGAAEGVGRGRRVPAGGVGPPHGRGSVHGRRHRPGPDVRRRLVADVAAAQKLDGVGQQE